MKNFLKKYKIDIIILSILLAISIVGVVCFSVLGKSKENFAYIYSESNLVEVIDLAKEKEEPRTFKVDGKNGYVIVEVKKNEIKIIDSTCPNKNCIHQGAATTLKPIICAHNEIVIELKGDKDVDVELG